MGYTSIPNRSHAKGLIFRNPNLESESLIQNLKNSLSRAIDFFPPLAGRLVAISHGDGMASFSVDCTNAGAEFSHAVAPAVSISDIIEPSFIPEIVASFMPANSGATNFDGISKPLLSVQVTCSANHAVMDGTSCGLKMEESSSLGGMFKLSGSNYSIWKQSMLDLLHCKDLYLPLHGDDAKPKDMSDDDWIIMHRKTVGYIRRFVEHNIFHHFANEEKADVLWKKMEAMFERKNALNKASIIRKIVRLRYVESANMTEHLNAYQGLINQSINMKISLDDEVIALLLLSSLPDSWDTLVVSISNSAPRGALTLQMVKDCLLNEESRRREQDHSSETKAMVAENSDRGRNKNRNSQNTRDKSRGKSKHKKDFKCHYCGGPNHYERDCRKKKRDQMRGNNENAEKDTMAVATDGDVVVVCDDACVSSSCQQTDWIVDSGASYHIKPYRDMFASYTGSSFGKVRMANHGVTEVAGIGVIHLLTDTGCKLVLRDVRHVPDIRLNIISTGKLDDDGYINHFGEGKWKLIKGSLIAAKGRKQNSLYLMHATLSNGEVNAVVKNSSIEIWHKRIGHLSQKGLEILARRSLIPEVKGMHLETCVDCLDGKQHIVAFKSFSPSRRAQPLDLVHTDLCYMKDITLVERQTGRKLKCVRADNGSKYQGPFELHCKNHDPVHSPTVQDYRGDIQPEQGDPIDDGASDEETRPAQDEVPLFDICKREAGLVESPHKVDGETSFWHFINSWSEISRGSESISKHPVFELAIAVPIDNRHIHLTTVEKNLVAPTQLPRKVPS
ncbi:hypothetical protein SASPL_145834 [Salvia splendens]|uniref:CCHC-type domain-containing protein n=1 Tax=Salvia splendens TaxID=180675 RepID=A0A8X8WJ56_SALSN|nr:hypothetical protein SASPL_145834 [Salvia splendens]